MFVFSIGCNTFTALIRKLYVELCKAFFDFIRNFFQLSGKQSFPLKVIDDYRFFLSLITGFRLRLSYFIPRPRIALSLHRKQGTLIIRDIFKSCTRCNSGIRITKSWIIDVSAYCTLILFHFIINLSF